MRSKYLFFVPVLAALVLITTCKKKNSTDPLPELIPEFNISSKMVLMGDSVRFTDQSLGGPETWQWTFERGTPSTSSQQNPVVVYPDSGNFDVSLRIGRGSESESLTKENEIQVDAVLAADFVADNDSVKVGESIRFTNLSTGASTFNWIFEGSTVPATTQENPIINYLNPGIYSVTLQASDGVETVSEIKESYIKVRELVLANFTADTTTIDAGGQIVFENRSFGGAESYQWIFEGGTPATSMDANPTVTYSSSDMFDVTLVAIRGIDRDTLYRTDYVTVLVPLVAGFSAEEDSVVESTIVNFIDESEGIPTSWSWSFEGGNPTSSTLQNPRVSYALPGNYDVTLQVTRDNKADEILLEDYIKVRSKISAAFEASENTIVEGADIDFVASEENGVNEWYWTFEGGTPATSTSKTPTVTYSSPGVYDVQLISVRGIDRDTLFENDHITVLEQLNVLISVNEDSIIAGTTVQFSDLSEGSPESWSWNFAGGTPLSSTAQNPQVIYTNPGTYDVTLSIARGSETLQKVFSDYIKVRPKLTADFNVPSGNTLKGDTVQYTANTSGNPDQFYWTFEGGEPATSTEENPKVVYKTEDVFDVTFEATRGELDEVEVIKQDAITVVKRLSPQFAVNPINAFVNDTVQYFDNTTGGPNGWLWTFNGANISQSTEQNPKVVYATAGDYGATLRSYYNDTYEEQAVNGAVGVYDSVEAEFSLDSLIWVGAQLNYSENSTGRIKDYAWSFEGGTPSASTLQTGTVNFASPGYFDVSLSVSNPLDSDTDSKAAYVEVLPQGLENYLLVYHDFRNASPRDKFRGVDYTSCLNCTYVTGTNGDLNGAVSTKTGGLRLSSTNTDAVFNEMTLSVWLETTNTGSLVTSVIERYNGSADFGMVVSMANGQLRLTGRDRSGNFRDVGTATPNVADGQWHHIVATLTSNSVWKLYIDGVEVLTADYMHFIDSFAIGTRINVGRSDTSIQPLQAEYDNVMLWGRPLSVSEIQALYNHQKTSY